MSPTNLIDEWRRARDVLIQRSVDKTATNDVTMRLTAAFGRLSPRERVDLEPLLREWLLSDNFADRFDAIAIVRENGVTAMIPTLRELQDRLESSADVGAPFEWAKVNRALGRLSTIAEPDPDPDERSLE